MLLGHAHIVRMRCTYARNGRTYDTYIYQKTSAVQLTSVGLAHARPNYVANLHINTGSGELCMSSGLVKGVTWD